MSFKNSWHPANIAAEWPKGSVVLVRVPDQLPLIHNYHYLLSLYFNPEFVVEGYEYLLVEEPKRMKS